MGIAAFPAGSRDRLEKQAAVTESAATPSTAMPAATAARRIMARGLATAGLLGFACNIGVLTVPLFNMEMFNRVLPTRDIATLWAMCGALAIALTCYAVLDHLRGAALGVLGNRLAHMLSPPLLQAIASFGPPDAASRSLSNGGSTAPRGEPLHDLEMVRQFVASPICVAPLDLVWTPVLLGVLLAQHWGYAVLAMLCCAVLCGLNVLGDTVARDQLLRSSHSEAGRVRAVAGAARAAEAVLAMGMLPALARRWGEMQRPARIAANRAMLRSRAIAALTRTLRMAMTGAMVTLGLVLVLAGDARNRRDVDNRPATRGLHNRDREFHPQEDAARVDCHQPVPGRGVEEILDRAAGEPGIVDEDVEPSILGEGGIDGRLPLRLARYVEAAEDRSTIRAGDVGDDPPPLFFQNVGDDDLGAFAGEDARHAGAHA